MGDVGIVFIDVGRHLSNYISHGPFAYKFFFIVNFFILILFYLLTIFNFKYVHVLFIRISTTIYNAWSISFDALMEFWKLVIGVL